jgi:hypothetical protein
MEGDKMLLEKIQPLFNFESLPPLTYRGNGLTHRDIISVAQFDTEKLDYIFARAHEMREMVELSGASTTVTKS